ncbi:AfsR/SARP family transcriptional regulator [Streptomyces sp. TLI_171]|uniref:AfsR/SARP family transcriptional regulator n=1 Tax=Streptomyces sp. TLI_171 TaxID=1938859 RepID=UPI0015D541F1
MLLLHPNRPVTLDRLIDALWGAQAPATAEASLRNLVARLRRALGDQDGQRLQAVPAGYRLQVAEDELDTLRFDAAVQRARAAHQAGDLPQVLDATAAALDLWRGDPLADLPELSVSVGESWRESRLQALEWRFDAELRGGRPETVVAELTGLTAEHPLREAFHVQLMQALDATGHRAKALETYQRLRTALHEELGVEPGPAVRQVHQRILAAPPPAPRPTKPAQLPSAPAHFIGREQPLATLRHTLLTPTERGAVAVVNGLAGIGKSALAIHCAHTLRTHFPDGQLFLNLHGATPGLTPLHPHPALSALLRALGVEPTHLPADVDTAAALLRTTLAGTRTLLVLDDAADTAQIRPLLPATPGCAVLVTSRNPLHTLDADLHLRLDTLTERDSITLVERTAGRATADRAVVSLEQADLARLVQLCGHHPLALRIAGARLATRRTLPVRNLVGRLEDRADRLDELELDDLSIRQSLALTYDSLRASARKPDQRAARALVAIGVLDLPEYTAPQLAGVLDLTPAQAATALDRLAETALLDETHPDRFAPHDLVRDYARELPDPTERTRLARTALGWYLAAMVRTAFVVDAPQHTTRRLPAVDPTAELPDRDSALAFGDAEHGNLLALVDGLAEEAWAAADLLTLVRAAYPVLWRRGRQQEVIRLNTVALRVAQREGDLFAEGYTLKDMAGMHFEAGRHLQALDLMDQCEQTWQRLGDRSQARSIMINRGLVLTYLSRKAEALELLERAAEEAAEDGDAYTESNALSALGNLVEADDPHAAIAYHRRSIEAGRRIDYLLAEAAGLNNLGYANLRLGDLAEALVHFGAVLDLHLTAGSWDVEFQARKGRIEALRRLRRLDEALAACRDLLDWAATLQGTIGSGLAEHLHGLVLRDLGRPEEALAAWQFALTRLADAQAPEVTELHTLIAEAQSA